MIESPQPDLRWLEVAGRRIALRRRPGGSPGLFWLGGFRSDMAGSKATALDGFAARQSLAMTRFDYSGHGESGRDYTQGTISDWLEEAVAVFEAETDGPQLVIGSSMGGWIALLLNRALRGKGNARIAGLVLIAPAIDMTEALMRAQFTEAEREELTQTGRVASQGDVITANLLADGEKHLMLGAPMATGCPVSILQGTKDESVPADHAVRLMTHLPSDAATLTLVPGGDHRLSRPEDLDLLTATVARMIAEVKTAL